MLFNDSVGVSISAAYFAETDFRPRWAATPDERAPFNRGRLCFSFGLNR
jgi:hypothetical protein